MSTVHKEALKQKYAEERAKRLRPDGNAQYLQLKDQLAHYLEDPYTPVTEREPKRDHAGFRTRSSALPRAPGKTSQSKSGMRSGWG